MESFIVLPTDVDEHSHHLILRGEEAHHALKSLRLRTGERLLATNLVGTTYECSVDGETANRELACRIDAVLHGHGEAQRNVELIQGTLSQPARWEFLLEKATELGAKVIVPVSTDRTERSAIKRDRSERILRAAVKQCKRSNLPWLKVPDSQQDSASGAELYSLFEALSDAVSSDRTILLLHEAARPEDSLHRFAQSVAPHRSIAVVVGPEGGFTEEEVARSQQEFGAHVVSLGDRRLRAETAAIAALALVIDQ